LDGSLNRGRGGNPVRLHARVGSVDLFGEIKGAAVCQGGATGDQGRKAEQKDGGEAHDLDDSGTTRAAVKEIAPYRQLREDGPA